MVNIGEVVAKDKVESKDVDEELVMSTMEKENSTVEEEEPKIDATNFQLSIIIVINLGTMLPSVVATSLKLKRMSI